MIAVVVEAVADAMAIAEEDVISAHHPNTPRQRSAWTA
jgi:hypothetical protein